jgi:hypothetical protein
MQKLIFFLLCLSTLLSFHTVNGQMDRRIGGQNQMQSPSPKQSKPVDPVVSTIDYLKKELELDSFQEAAVSVYVKERFSELDKIVADNSLTEEKVIHAEKLNATLDEKIAGILNPEQMKKFEEIVSNRTNKKASSKKKKKDRKKEN